MRSSSDRRRAGARRVVPELRYQSAVIGAVALAVVTQEAKRQVGPRRIWNVVLSVEALTLAFGQRFSGGISRQRLRGAPALGPTLNVLSLPAACAQKLQEWPTGRFDLIVCSGMDD